MEDNKTIFNYLGQLFATYGIIVLIFIVLGCTVGENAKDFSPLYQYGKEAISIPTLVQLFLMTCVITAANVVFFSDRFIRNMVLVLRSILFFSVVIVAIVLFIIAFKWFALDNVGAWIGFVISFSLCSVIGVVIGVLKEKSENEKMEKALAKLRHS